MGTAELYDPGTNTWTPAAAMQRSRISHTVTLLKTGEVLVVGAIFDPQEAELYGPKRDAFELLAFPVVPRSGHTATRLLDGRVLLAGGQAGEQNAVASAEIYGPANCSR